MADLILDAIKTFLYERQEPEEGQLDGTFYMFKGLITVKENIKFLRYKIKLLKHR